MSQGSGRSVLCVVVPLLLVCGSSSTFAQGMRENAGGSRQTETSNALSVPPRQLGTPLHEAVAYHDVARIQQLLGSGVDPNITNHVGMTALHLAVLRGQYDIAVLLLDSGANIDLVSTGSSLSPVMSALTHGRMTNDWSLFQEFLRRGADVTKRTGGPLSDSLLDYASLLSEYCIVNKLLSNLDGETITGLADSRTLVFLARGSGNNEREETCRQSALRLVAGQP